MNVVLRDKRGRERERTERRGCGIIYNLHIQLRTLTKRRFCRQRKKKETTTKRSCKHPEADQTDRVPYGVKKREGGGYSQCAGLSRRGQTMVQMKRNGTMRAQNGKVTMGCDFLSCAPKVTPHAHQDRQHRGFQFFTSLFGGFFFYFSIFFQVLSGSASSC